jgi:hypothetical protein
MTLCAAADRVSHRRVIGGTVAIIRLGVPADLPAASGFVDCGAADTVFGLAPRMMLPVQ